MKSTAKIFLVCILVLGWLVGLGGGTCWATGGSGLEVHSYNSLPYGVTYDEGDLHVKGGYYLSLRGVEYDSSNSRDSGLEFADARPIIEGSMRTLSWRIEGDLVGTDTRRNLYDLWLGWNPCSAFRIKAGQFRVALGSEYDTHDSTCLLWATVLPHILTAVMMSVFRPTGHSGTDCFGIREQLPWAMDLASKETGLRARSSRFGW